MISLVAKNPCIPRPGPQRYWRYNKCDLWTGIRVAPLPRQFGQHLRLSVTFIITRSVGFVVTLLRVANVVVDVGEVRTALDLDTDHAAVIIRRHFLANDDAGVRRKFNQHCTPRCVRWLDAGRVNRGRRRSHAQPAARARAH